MFHVCAHFSSCIRYQMLHSHVLTMLSFRYSHNFAFLFFCFIFEWLTYDNNNNNFLRECRCHCSIQNNIQNEEFYCLASWFFGKKQTLNFNLGHTLLFAIEPLECLPFSKMWKMNWMDYIETCEIKSNQSDWLIDKWLKLLSMEN